MITQPHPYQTIARHTEMVLKHTVDNLKARKRETEEERVKE